MDPKTIPIYVLSFNNPTYVTNTLNQLIRLRLASQVVIVDNASTYPGTIECLAHFEKVGIKVTRMSVNHGHKVVFNHVATPDVFVITDPDLQYHRDMPTDVIEQLLGLSERYKHGRVALALNNDKDLQKDIPNYYCGWSLQNWEAQNWATRIPDDDYEIYRAGADTTFTLVNKKHPYAACMRVAGRFTCIHLPWCKHPVVAPSDAELSYYLTTGRADSSTVVNNTLKK